MFPRLGAIVILGVSECHFLFICYKVSWERTDGGSVFFFHCYGFILLGPWGVTTPPKQFYFFLPISCLVRGAIFTIKWYRMFMIR
jgi:hypothetical protein